MLNEVLQWLTLAAIFLLVLALYRQLGSMLTGPQEEATYSFGPHEGSSASSVLRRLAAGGAEGRPTLLVFVAEGCPTCEILLAEVRNAVWRDAVELVVVYSGDSSFAASLADKLPTARLVGASSAFRDGTPRLNGRDILNRPGFSGGSVTWK